MNRVVIHIVNIAIALLILSNISTGQTTVVSNTDTLYLVEKQVIDGDTLASVYIDEVKVFYRTEFKNWWHKMKYTRLVYNVKKAYPFAVIARNELKKLNDSLVHITDKRERKNYIADYEKAMFREYEADLRSLTFTQGRIMLKLVDREIGNTPYALIQEYRGNVSAIFWQGIARLFSSNLKIPYDPYGEDAEIEEIVQLIEAGLI